MAVRADIDLKVNMSSVKRSMDRAAREINKTVQNVSGKDISFNVNGKSFTQPLGRITASANEFTKSLEASNARVIAFGASVGIINAITDSFKFLVAETIRFEKTLQDINVVLNSSNEQIEKFGQGLFDVAQNTAQSFNIAADAALEFSRQGLSVEEVLKRTNDALTLTRITSLDAAEAVSGLTAAVNAFGNAGLTTTDIIDKLAAVDVKFAVSSEDLINGLERAGAVAIDAGVSLDSLVGIITSLQQTTARGGAVIGNGLKTIFTRIQRPESLRQLEDMGIAVRGLTGAILPADQVLKSIAKTFDSLTQAQQSNIVQFSAGIFQANIFRAALTDLAKTQGIQQQATEISASAAGEAARKNELLNKSISAMASQAGSGLKELVGIIGELSIKPELGEAVGLFGNVVESLKNALGGGEDEGNSFAKGLVRGIGNVLTGPGVVAFAAIFSKLLFNVFKFASGSLRDVLGIVTQKEKIRQIEQSIVSVLGSNVQITQALNRLEGDRVAQEQYILGIIEAQTNALAKQQQLASKLGPSLLSRGISPDLTYNNTSGTLVDIDGDGSFRSSGLLPQEKNTERRGAIEGGYSPGRVTKMKVPGMGEVIYNTAEKVKNFQGMKQPAIMPPESSKAGKKYKEKFADKHGFDPYASGGFIPNFAQRVGDTLIMDPSRFFTFINPFDAAKALGKGVSYKDIEDKIALQKPVRIKASLKDIIFSSEKGKNTITGKEDLAKTFYALDANGIKFIERDFLFRQNKRGGARKRKGELHTEFAERKATAQLNEEQDTRRAAGSTFTKYLSTYDPQTKKGDPVYPIDHIAKGIQFSSGETKGGEFNAANLISKSLRMASDRGLETWMESQKISRQGLGELNLKRAQNLAKRLGIKGTGRKGEFTQEDADDYGMNKGFVPNYADFDEVYNTDKKTISGKNQYLLKNGKIFHPNKGQAIQSGGEVLGTLINEGKIEKENHILPVNDLLDPSTKLQKGFPLKNKIKGADFQASVGIKAYYGDKGGATSAFDWSNKKTIGDKKYQEKGLYDPESKINKSHTIKKSLYADAATSGKAHNLSKMLEKASNTSEVENSLRFSMDEGNILHVAFPDNVVEFIKGRGTDGYEFISGGSRGKINLSKNRTAHVHDIVNLGKEKLGLEKRSIQFVQGEIFRDYVNAGKGYVPNFSYRMMKDILARGKKPLANYGIGYDEGTNGKLIGETLKNKKKFLTEHGFKNFSKYMSDQGKPVIGIRQGTLGPRNAYWINSPETLRQVEAWGKMPNLEITSLTENKAKEAEEQIEKQKNELKFGKFESTLSDGSMRFDSNLQSVNYSTELRKKLTSKLGKDYRYIEYNKQMIEKFAKDNDAMSLEKFSGGSYKRINAKKAVEDIINLPASKINELGVFRPRKPNNLELDFINETRSNKQIKWKVQDDPSSKSGKSFSLQASNPGAFKNFQSFLKEKKVPLRNIENIQKKINERYRKFQELDKPFRTMGPGGRESKRMAAARGISNMAKEGTIINTDGLYIKNLGGLVKEYNQRVQQMTEEELIPNFASTTLYRGTSPKYQKAVKDIPNPPQFLFDEIMAANTKSDFINAVKKLGISHSMGAYSGSYNDGVYPATIEQIRGHEEMDENQILQGGYVYPRPLKGGFGKQDGTDITPRHQPSGFVSRTVDKDVARSFAKSSLPGYEYDPNEMGKVEEVSVPNKRILDQTKLEKYIDRFGLENVKKSFKDGMRKGTLKDIYLNLHKFRPKVQSTDPLDMFSPNAGESERSIGMSGGSLTRDEKEVTQIWSKHSPYFGQNKGLIPNFNVNLSNGYHDKKAIGKAIGKVYKSKTGSNLKKQDLSFAVERYISAIKDKQADDSDGYISSYPGGHFTAGGQKFNFNEISMALLGHGQFHKSFKNKGFIPNFAQKIRNGAIYHSKSNNKAVRVKRAHQAEQIAYIKHHGQDHMFESEVPFSDLIPATKEQVQKYLGKKSAGLIPNFVFDSNQFEKNSHSRKVNEQMFGTVESRTKALQNRNKLNREKALRGEDPKLFDRHYPDPILGQARKKIINAPIGGGERNVAQAIRSSKRIEKSKKEELIKQIGSQRLKNLDEKYLDQSNKNSHISRLQRFAKQRKSLESAIKSENFEKAREIKNADFIENQKIYNEYASYLGETRYLDSDVSTAKRAQERFGKNPHSGLMNDPNTLGYYPGITKSYGAPGEKSISYNPYQTDYVKKGPRPFRDSGLIPNFSKVTKTIRAQENRVRGKREFVGRGLSEGDKDIAFNMFDYFISKISGLSSSFGLNKKRMSLTGTPDDRNLIETFKNSGKSEKDLIQIAGSQRKLKNILDDYMLGHFESLLLAKGKFKEAKDPLMQGDLSKGLVPNFSNPLQEAIQREESAGVPKSKIRIEKSSQLKSPMNPMGLAVTNTRDEPGGIAQGIRRAKEQRMDPKKYGASKGLVPNFQFMNKNYLKGGEVQTTVPTKNPFMSIINPELKETVQLLKQKNQTIADETKSTNQKTEADKKNIQASGDNLTKLFFFQSTLSMANGFLQEFAATGSGATRNLASFGESVSNVAGSIIQQKTLIDEVLQQTGQQGQGVGFGALFGSLGKKMGGKQGPLSSLFGKIGPLVKGLGTFAKGITRFLPLVGQLFVGFTVVNEVVKKFSSSLANLPVVGKYFAELEEGEGILDLFKSSADRAKSSLERLSKQGEILSSTLEQITKIEEKQTKISELQALGSKRTNKEDQQLFQAEIDLLEAQNNLEKKLNEAISNIKDKELSSKIEGIINKGIDTVEVKKLLEDLQKQNMQGQVARTISAGFLERADKKDFDFDEIINRSELNMVGSRSVKALDENQLEMAAAGDISSVEKLMPQLFKKINENKRNYGVLAKAVQVAAKKQLEENNVRKQIAEAAVDSKKLLDREYFLMDQRYKNALLRNSLAEKIVDSEQKILDANQKILLEKGVLSQSQGISSEFSLKQQRIDFDLNKKINDARQKALQDILKATKETITFDFGPDAREGKPISDILNFNIDGKARKNIEDDLGIEFKDDDVQKVQDLFNSLSKELEGVQDATSATVKIAQKYKDISDSNVATLFALGLTEANLYGTKTKSLDTVKKALAEEDAALLNARMSAAIQMQSLAEEEKRAEISKKTVKGAEILAATYLKQGSIAQVQEKVAKSEVENRKGIVLNLALQNKIEEKKLAQLKTSGVLLEQSIVEQVKKNRAEAESSELSLNQTLAQIMILTSLEKESDVRKTAEAVLENKFKSEIANAELAAIEAEKREEFFGIQQNLNALAQAQVASEQSNARVAAQLNLEKLKILTKNEGINAEVETQLKEEITSTQKTALLTASKALLLSHNKKQAELLQKANTLQELSNKYTEAENAIRQANISNAELSTNTGLGLITEKAQAFSETRSAGERALQTGDPKDMLAYAQKLEQTNKLFGTGTEVIDRLRVKMAEMSESASNLKAELVETGIENLRGNMVQMFKDIGSGAKSVGEAYTDLGLGLAEAILDKMMQKNVDAIISNLTYAFTGVDEKSDAQTISESNNLLSNSLDSAAKAMQQYADEIARLRNDVSYSVQDRDNGTIDGQGFSSQTFMDDIKNKFDGIKNDLQTIIASSGAKSNSIGLQTTGGSDKPFENFEARSEEVLKNFVDNFATKSGVLGEHLFTSLESAITRALGNIEPKSIVPIPQVTAQTEGKEESNKAEGTTNEEIKAVDQDKVKTKLEELRGEKNELVQTRNRHARAKTQREEYLTTQTQINAVSKEILALEQQDLSERRSRQSKRTLELKMFSDNKSSKSTKTTDKFWGGKIQRFAKGGLVEGPGGMDNVPAMLTAGEYVVPREEVQKFEKGGKLGKRITRGLKGAAQGAVMTMTADAINKAMGKTAKKESPPTFNMNRLEPTKLGSSVSMAVSDPRMSGRVLAQSQTIQDYKDFLLEKAAFETRKKNEKVSEKMGFLKSALGTLSSYAMSGITEIVKKPLAKAISFAKRKAGNVFKGHLGFGKHSDAFKQARRRGYKVNYKDVAKSFDSGESLIVMNSKTKQYNELKPVTSQDGGIFDTSVMQREVDFDNLESVNKYQNNLESTYKRKQPEKFNLGGKIPAMLTAGEGFIPSKIAQKIGYQNLESMNRNGSIPTVQGNAGIDKIGPVGLDEGDFIIRKSSTDKLMRDNPNTMRFAMQNPDGFRRAATGYYEGGIVGTANQSNPSFTQSNTNKPTAQPTNRIQPLIESTQAQQTEKISPAQNNEITNNINVNVTIDGSGKESVETQTPEGSYEQEQELAMKIKTKVLEVIRQEKRLGGELDK